MIALEDIPLERADDSRIRKSMQDLNELIHQHVENHYHMRHFQGRSDHLMRKLMTCGYTDGTEPSAQSLAVLLINPGTRGTAIRQIIASIIIRHIDLNSEAETSLLPGHILAFYQAISKRKRLRGEEEGQPAQTRSLVLIMNADNFSRTCSILQIFHHLAPSQCSSALACVIPPRNFRA